jgi:CheY-like chemotaxis protein
MSLERELKMNKKILLVEDQVLIARSEKMDLEKIGYSVITVKSGESAVEMVKADQDIHLILMDIDLGSGIDGAEAAAAILETRDIPVIFLSNQPETLIKEKNKNLRTYGYVMKGSCVTTLDAAIKTAFALFETKKNLEHSANCEDRPDCPQ